MSEFKIIKILGVKFLLLHGHQMVPWNDEVEIERLRRTHDVDVVIGGHIPVAELRTLSKGVYINPGSVTGMQLGRENEEGVASFALIKLGKNRKGMVYFYRLDEKKQKKVQIDKESFSL